MAALRRPVQGETLRVVAEGQRVVECIALLRARGVLRVLLLVLSLLRGVHRLPPLLEKHREHVRVARLGGEVDHGLVPDGPRVPVRAAREQPRRDAAVAPLHRGVQRRRPLRRARSITSDVVSAVSAEEGFRSFRRSASSSASSVARSPFFAATWSGVYHVSFFALCLAPRRHRNATHAALPSLAATCRGASPRFASRRSISAPWSRRKRHAATSPRSAAT